MCSGITVGLVGEDPLVTCGLTALMRGHDDIHVVPVDPSSSYGDLRIDVALLDSARDPRGERRAVEAAVGHPRFGRVAVFTWSTDERRIRTVLQAGASGLLSKRLGPAALTDGLRRIHAGAVVVDDGTGQARSGASDEWWPGREHGLTRREAEVLSLVCEGLSNEEIGSRLHLSLDTVKMYVRSSYSRIGVRTRSQAVIWGLGHGMRSTRL